MDLSKLLSSIPPESDRLSELPPEIKRKVLDFLDFEDYLNIRLLSRVWSILAFERTWDHGLVLRPNRNHAQKLIEVSRRPWLRERVKKIVFSVDDIDYFVVRVWIERSSDPEVNKYAADLAKLDSDFDRILTRPSQRLTQGAVQQEFTIPEDFCDANLLARTLTVLTSIRSIHIKFGEYPFLDRSLATPWNSTPKRNIDLHRVFTIQDQTIAVRSYSGILMGANAAVLPFTHLRLDSMPVLCFVSPNEAHIDSPLNHLATMRSSVQYVQDLDVQFSGCQLDYLTTESRMIPRNLALFLGAMPLRNLTVAWADLQVYSSKSHIHDLSSPFYDLTFPHLATLRILHISPHMHMTPTLHSFLSRHSSTLKFLHINGQVVPYYKDDYHPRECRCVWKQTLLKIRKTMKLEKFELLLIQADGLRIYDDDWKEVDGTKKADAKLLERFVLGVDGGHWLPSEGHKSELCPLESGMGSFAEITEDFVGKMNVKQWRHVHDNFRDLDRAWGRGDYQTMN